MTQKSLRSQLVSLCHDLIHDKDHNNDIMEEPKTPSQQQMGNIPIETALHRNPYAIFLHDPNIIAANLNTSVEKVKQTRRQAANCIMKHDTMGTGSHDLISLHTNGNLVVSSTTSNLLVEYYQQKNVHNEITVSYNPYFSTGSTHFDEWLKQRFSVNCTISKLSRKRLRFQHQTTTTEMHDDPHHSNGIHDENHPNTNNGGIPLGQVTQIVGPSASGKTQLGLSISAQAILFHPELCKVHYIVGGGGNSSLVAFSRRFKSIASALLLQQQQQQRPSEEHERQERYGHVMHKFEISPTYNAYMLLSRLNEIEAYLEAQVQHAKEKLNCDIMEDHDDDETETNQHSHLIVIDSISGCISSLIWGDGDGGAGVSLMNEIVLSLRRLSRMERFHGCPRVAVVVMNGAVTNRLTHGMKSALGEAWRAADSTILLEPLYSTLDIDFKTHPVGTPFVRDKVVRVKNDEMDENDETVQFRISSHGITNV